MCVKYQKIWNQNIVKKKYFVNVCKALEYLELECKKKKDIVKVCKSTRESGAEMLQDNRRQREGIWCVKYLSYTMWSQHQPVEKTTQKKANEEQP